MKLSGTGSIDPAYKIRYHSCDAMQCLANVGMATKNQVIIKMSCHNKAYTKDNLGFPRSKQREAGE
jgi:hypothetical protein